MDVTWTDVNENKDEQQPTEQPTPDQKQAYRYAGFWVRFWAYIIDLVVVFSLRGILLSPFLFINNGLPVEVGLWTINGFFEVLIYYAYFFLTTKFLGQTIGKMIIGIRVVKEDGSKLMAIDVLFREVIGRLIYNIIGMLKILYVVIGFTNEKQGLHDMIGQTRVIHVKD